MSKRDFQVNYTAKCRLCNHVKKDNAPENFAVLRQIAVNVLGKEKRVKLGIKNKQFLAAMDNNYLARVFGLG
ncbi:hypothetical protein [Nostoc sp. LPT]|uniref:hypothetical protein n=1 Tax=Nostoc sp. LPT TaxID=2815387 RepID=UPI001D5275F8|nr:hypothetical protein [Nostoc sp. LPT]MBN4003772.1 hypothetical protein [Nostoc sp. LPT]